MLFRRVRKHIKQGEWFAVLVDFLIVVAGVYIGLQLGNSNAARADKLAYQQALERFSIETQTNLESLDVLDEGLGGYLKLATNAFNILQSCEDSPENLEILNTGITAITGTYGLNLRHGALDELTSSPRLLAQQSTEDRAILSDTKYYFDFILREASLIETLPLQERLQNNPILGIGDPVYRTVTYAGADFSRTSRPLYLKVPISQACQDNDLIKSFYTWERWQQVLPTFSREMRSKLTKVQDIFE